MRVVIGNVHTKLVDPDERLQLKLQQHLSTFAPGYKYTWQYKNTGWDGKVSLYQQCSFPTGLLPSVIHLIPNPELEDRRCILYTPTLHPCTVPLRDYQFLCAETALTNVEFGTWWPRGVLKVATGGGKTEIAVAIYQMTQVPTLFIVDEGTLLQQAVDRFAKYGIEAGILGQGQMDLTKQVTVATIQTLMQWKHKINPKKHSKEAYLELLKRNGEKQRIICNFLAGIEQVFVDEAHMMAANLDKGNMFTDALNLMDNAYMRWGLTATPFMREQYHNWLLEGTCGKLLYEKTNRELIDEGYLAEAKVTMYKVPNHKTVPKEWPDCYEDGIVAMRSRNNQVVQCIRDMQGPILVLVDRDGHGKLLQEMCKAALGIDVPFIYGKHKVAERQEAVANLRNGTHKAVIASKIWNKGVDIAEIRTLINASGGKSIVKIMQQMGRGLRLAEGKGEVNIVDFMDMSGKYLPRHSRARKGVYEDQGFDVKVEKLCSSL